VNQVGKQRLDNLIKQISRYLGSAELLVLAAFCLLVFYSPDVFAHARWFIDEQKSIEIPSVQKSMNFQAAIAASAIVAVFTLISFTSLVEQVLFKYIKPIYYMAFVHKDKLGYFLKITVAISLLYFSWQMDVLVPNIPSPEQGLWLVIGLQIIIAVLFVLNAYTVIGASLLLLTYAILMVSNYWIALEHLQYVGIALFIIISDSRHKKLKLLKHNAVDILRISTGAALVFLGLGEKILQPDLGAAFLAENQVNFVKIFLYPEFKDEYFVMCAGLAEISIGLMFIFGYSVRVLTLALIFLMTAANIYTLEAKSISLAITELAGHLPFFGIILQLIAFGDGKTITVRRTSYLKYPVAPPNKLGTW
jgi:uncharacterized membrane protein YphA (DoxX/SURF4 family)